MEGQCGTLKEESQKQLPMSRERGRLLKIERGSRRKAQRVVEGLRARSVRVRWWLAGGCLWRLTGTLTNTDGAGGRRGGAAEQGRGRG